jgi:hypothetical protein
MAQNIERLLFSETGADPFTRGGTSSPRIHAGTSTPGQVDECVLQLSPSSDTATNSVTVLVGSINATNNQLVPAAQGVHTWLSVAGNGNNDVVTVKIMLNPGESLYVNASGAGTPAVYVSGWVNRITN